MATYVSLLRGVNVGGRRRLTMDEIASRWAGNDLLAPGRGAVYLWCPDGYGRTKLGNSLFERELDVVATTRNWRTVSKLVEMSGAP